MKLLYETNNNSKVYNMRRRLENIPIELITPKEFGIKYGCAAIYFKKI